ncbi:MAG: PfkB protein [Patescibacteria group bacterium]|jgi:sugar/nucleoside kinase (ribokinase family)|nr:PfkB protein [Patescibacteria group bacterium]
MSQSKKIDFLSIGDVFNDIFIELEDANVTCDINHANCTISMKFADKIPYKKATAVLGVGNAGNAAVSAARLGLNTGLLTFIGKDSDGEKIFDYFNDEGISRDLISQDATLPTNVAYVLQYGPERTILVKQEAYPYTVPTSELDANTPSWIYLTSIGKSALGFQHELVEWITKHPEVQLAFQPGTFQLKAGKSELSDVYARTNILFCNQEESARILEVDSIETSDALIKLSQLGPKVVVITDGPKGAHAYDSETKEMWSVPMYPDIKDPVDRTGAGDAFASTVVAALALGKPLSEALIWGPINSMSVVQEIGAQKGLLSQEKILSYLDDAPGNYGAKKIG